MNAPTGPSTACSSSGVTACSTHRQPTHAGRRWQACGTDRRLHDRASAPRYWPSASRATVANDRAPQVMVKVTGGGRGMAGICGALPLHQQGRAGCPSRTTAVPWKAMARKRLRELAEQWR